MNIVTRLNIGGPVLQLATIAKGMGEEGFAPVIVAGQCESDEGDMCYALSDADVRSVSEMSRSIDPWRNLRALWQLWRLMRREQPLVVHTHTAMAGCLGRLAAMLAGVPVIIHTFHGNSLREYFSPPMNAVFLAIERLLARGTDAICVLSEQQLRELSDDLRIAERSRFNVIPLGLDLTSFAALVPSSLENGRFNVGWFGRLVPVKNISLLVDVIENTLTKADNIDFHIAGDGRERKLVGAAVQRFGSRVKWHGWLKDIAPLVRRCSLVLQTSHNEGTPVALIQGSAAGRPFLSTSVGGIVDMTCGEACVATPGARWFDNAILAEPCPQAFAAAIARLAGHPEQLAAMGRAARNFAMSRYREEQFISTLGSLYRELIERKLPHAVPVQA